MRKKRGKAGDKIVELDIKPVNPSFPKPGSRKAPKIDLEEAREKRDKPSLERLKITTTALVSQFQVTDHLVAEARVIVDALDNEHLREQFYDTIAVLEEFKDELSTFWSDLN